MTLNCDLIVRDATILDGTGAPAGAATWASAATASSASATSVLRAPRGR